MTSRRRLPLRLRSRNYSIAIQARRLCGALMLISVCAVASATAATADDEGSQATRVTVVMTEYRFTPSQLTFHRGVHYRLVLRNQGGELHEFTAPDFFKAVTVENPSVLARDGGDAVVQPGQTKEVDFVAKTPGRYALSCADHDWAGMTGEIVIE